MPVKKDMNWKDENETTEQFILKINSIRSMMNNLRNVAKTMNIDLSEIGSLTNNWGEYYKTMMGKIHEAEAHLAVSIPSEEYLDNLIKRLETKKLGDDFGI